MIQYVLGCIRPLPSYVYSSLLPRVLSSKQHNTFSKQSMIPYHFRYAYCIILCTCTSLYNLFDSTNKLPSIFSKLSILKAHPVWASVGVMNLCNCRRRHAPFVPNLSTTTTKMYEWMLCSLDSNFCSLFIYLFGISTSPE